MDAHGFDDLTRSVARATTRRGLLRGLVAGFLGGLAATPAGASSQRAARQPNGAPCSRATDCTSLKCADGVCCAERCSECRVCNLPGNEGFCGPAPDGRACDGGLCCEGGCVDVQADVEHCGACGNACPGLENGRAICVDGICATECLPGFKQCAADGPCIPDTSCCADAECQATDYCDAETRACLPDLPAGEPCDRDA